MSDDEPYDADGDVGRFLHCPSPEAPLLFPLSEPEATPPAGLFQDAPTADEQVHGNNPAAPPPALPAPAEQVQDHPTIDDAEQHQTPVMDHQAAAGMDVEQYQGMAMDVQPMHMLMAPEMQQGGYGFPRPTLVQRDGVVNAEHYEAAIMAAAEHYQAPAMNAEDHQAQAMDVEPQHQAMAMVDDVQPAATHLLAAGPETITQQQAYGAFPWLAGESMYPPPSPSLLEKLQELAAMLDGIEAGGSGSGGAAAAGAEADAAALCPAEEDVAFRPIARGQLDCSRCRTVREVVTLNGTCKVHFMVHSAHPETFQHGIVDRMLIGADGNFHTYVLLHHDLRGRRHEWVMNFIAMSVEKMKRHGVQVLQDTYGAPSDGAAASCTDDTDDSHAHMDVELDTPNNSLSATADQAISPDEAAQPSIPGAAAPETAQPAAVTQQAQEHADAPSSEAAADQPPTSQAPPERNDADAGENSNFPPFNWEGFQTEILESSHVEPYDPASGVSVLMYPSMQEQLRQHELKKKEGKKLSKMAVTDTPDYLNLNDDHCANAPNFSSAPFKGLCEKDRTYRLYKRRVSGLTRKIKKLELSAARVGTGGLFKIKQKMESYKHEKEELYDMIKRAMQENERRNDDGAGPSNRAAGPPANSAGPSNGGAAGPSDAAAAGTSNTDAGSSSAAAVPSNVASPSSGTN